MNTGKYIFAQLLQFINGYEFEKCVIKYNGDHGTGSLIVGTNLFNYSLVS
ncbi:DUF4372 domain-containing protein [Salegentibacter echinorum]